MLKRSPYYLRVTNDAGAIDALDLEEDSPRPGEKLYAYEMCGLTVNIHVRASGGRGGFFSHAEYRIVQNQPIDAEMRTTAAWAKWCSEHRPHDLKEAVARNSTGY